MDNSKRYTKLNHREHIIQRPDSYVGSIKNEIRELYICENNKIIKKNINFNPAFFTCFNEILTNASDHYLRTKQVTYIKINVYDDKVIIENDGSGIPIEIHKQENIYIPELIFGNFLTSENFDDSIDRTWGGRNGYGAKLTNVFSTKFIIETADGKNKYVQTFTNNMIDKSKPKITKSTKNYTRITYYPDFEKFGLNNISEDSKSVFLKRAIDIAAYSPNVNVYYNDILLPIKSFKDYMKMFIDGDEELFYEKINENWEIGIAKSTNDTFQQVSMVNGISTHVGGSHVNYISNQIVKSLDEKIKAQSVKPNMIKNHLFVFVNCRIPNPSFETQTKENLTTRMVSDLVKDVVISDTLIKKLMSSSIKNDIVNFASFKEFQSAKKSTQNSSKTKIRIDKLDDANFAGKAGKTINCHLFLTEGDSASATAKRGFSVTGNDYFGLFPLKGKPLNVKKATLQKMIDNEEISSIISALGLEIGKKYKSTRELRYGKLVIMSDMDTDGSHIKGLILNLFDTYWPELLELEFIYEFITPIVKIQKGKIVKYFYKLSEYKKWKNGTNTSGYFIKYFKGLGTIEPKEAKLFFTDIDKHLIKFNSSDITKERDLIDLVFNEKRDRKEWLLNYKPSQELDKFKTKQTYESFFNNEFIEFSMADNIRSIPSIVDGLKPSQRKILYTLFKRNFKNEVKVELLMGSILELSAYHHGPASLEQTIIGLAQDFVGSNNINLLEPNGEYGTRTKGGKNSSASRYIFTKLSDITREIFKSDDDDILEYLFDDGYQIEPKYYIPIIPMSLINGADGIGTGWSTFIPHFNPIDIVTYIENKLKNKKQNIDLVPWFKGFKGEIIEDPKNNRYITKGIFKMLPNNKINITELPIFSWNSSYYEFLNKLIDDKYIKDYDKYCTDSDVNIIITFPEEIFAKLTPEIITKKFNLESYISVNNMHLFDENNKIKLYKNQYEIIDEFIELRLKYYTKRKENILKKLDIQSNYIKNKITFINCVLNKKIIFENKTKQDIIAQIESNKIEKHNDNFDYLLNISLISLSAEKVEELKSQFEKVKLEIEKISKQEETNIWLSELKDLKKNF